MVPELIIAGLFGLYCIYYAVTWMISVKKNLKEQTDLLREIAKK